MLCNICVYKHVCMYIHSHTIYTYMYIGVCTYILCVYAFVNIRLYMYFLFYILSTNCVWYWLYKVNNIYKRGFYLRRLRFNKITDKTVIKYLNNRIRVSVLCDDN